MYAFAAIAVLIAIRLTGSESLVVSGRRYQVTVARVLDGDTFETSGGQRVRLLGVDSPEIQHGEKLGQPFGQEAKIWLDTMCGGKQVRLHEGAAPLDRYGRTLAWVYLKDGRLINQEILSTGHARLLERFGLPLELEEQLRKAEADAQLAKMGLWDLK